MTRGWSSDGLKTVGTDEELWTAAEAAVLLGPPDLSVSEVRRLIRERGLRPVGKRRVTGYGQSGRHARVFLAVDLIRAYDELYKGRQEKEP